MAMGNVVGGAREGGSVGSGGNWEGGVGRQQREEWRLWFAAVAAAETDREVD
jgi:hypothetical protein